MKPDGSACERLRSRRVYGERALMVALSWQGVWLIYLVLSGLALLLYGWDKQAARSSWRRVPERRLHLVALFGGWPGAWLAQRLFRHKTRKIAFRRRFLATVLLNLIAALWVLYAAGLLLI